MRLLINGDPAETGDDVDLAALVSQYNREGTPVAVAVNGRFVPRETYGQTTLNDGDEIELLSPMMGG